MLKIRFEIWNTTILMQILEQSEEYFRDFYASNGIRIQSTGFPELTEKIIFLRGRHEKNNFNIASYTYDTKQEAEEALEKYIDALRELEDYINDTDNKNIFTFM